MCEQRAQEKNFAVGCDVNCLEYIEKEEEEICKKI